MFTTSGTYPWLFVTQIFHKGQPSSRSFPNTKFAKQTQLVRTDWRLDIQCFEIRKSGNFVFDGGAHVVFTLFML